MKIETKYNIGDEVWFPFGGKPYKSKVKAIYIYHINGNIFTRYIMEDMYGESFMASRERHTYSSQEELLKNCKICQQIN